MSLVMAVGFVAGILLVSYGAWSIYEPVGFVVLGISLIVASALWVRGAEQ